MLLPKLTIPPRDEKRPGKRKPKGHVLRDSKIIYWYEINCMSQIEIAKRLKTTQASISRILKRNEEFLLSGRKYEKSERIKFLKRQLFHKNGLEKTSEKDVVDIISELRKEYEGDGQQQPTINNITYNIHGARKDTILEEKDLTRIELIPEKTEKQ